MVGCLEALASIQGRGVARDWPPCSRIRTCVLTFYVLYILHSIISTHPAGRRQNGLNPVGSFIINTWPTDHLCKVVQNRPRRARHLAQVACMLAIGLAGRHAVGGAAGWRDSTPPADERPFVLNCNFLTCSLGKRKVSGSLLLNIVGLFMRYHIIYGYKVISLKFLQRALRTDVWTTCRIIKISLVHSRTLDSCRLNQ